jgi:hypothetical protein
MERMAGAGGGNDERLVVAHRALRDAGDIQFSMGQTPPPKPSPAWLKSFGEWLRDALAPIGRFLAWIDSLLPDLPYVRIVFWAMVALMAGLLLWIVVDRFRHGVWRLPKLGRRTYVAASENEAEWRPDAAPVRGWLQEADALAAQGRYAEAAHHLLLRSIEDLANRRPQLVRPALTARDLARAPGLPAGPRALFAQIAAVVERSLFGGRAVGAEEWRDCRAAYADFAQTGNWAPGAGMVQGVAA